LCFATTLMCSKGMYKQPTTDHPSVLHYYPWKPTTKQRSNPNTSFFTKYHFITPLDDITFQQWFECYSLDFVDGSNFQKFVQFMAKYIGLCDRIGYTCKSTWIIRIKLLKHEWFFSTIGTIGTNSILNWSFKT
jgi:hypothetical protein